MSESDLKIPFQARVSDLVDARYRGGHRPNSWDERRSGIDTVRFDDGRVIRLLSDGQQSPPQKGWTILVTGGDSSNGYLWTLYGMPKAA